MICIIIIPAKRTRMYVLYLSILSIIYWDKSIIKYNNLIEYTKNYLSLKVTRQNQRDETTRIQKLIFELSMDKLIREERKNEK